jgi:putative FmdB family regulatory protein
MGFPRKIMPIYAYKCADCGFAKDVLQKMSDPLLTVCPSCGKPEFKKQVTAAGFQLKGSGWYATDFKGGSGGTSAPATDAKSASSENGAAANSAATSSAAEPVKSSGTDSGSGSNTTTK